MEKQKPTHTAIITSPKIFLRAALSPCAVFLLSPLCIQGQLCVPPPSGLVSWWRAEGDALDSGETNNGTLAGNTSFNTGRMGQEFVFDGSGDAVQVGNPSNLQQDFTIEAWIKRANASLATYSGDTDESAICLSTFIVRSSFLKN